MDHEKISENKEHYRLEQLPVAVNKCIDNIIKVEDFNKFTVRKELLRNDGNFLSDLYTVDICGNTDDGEKRLSFIVKQSIILEKIDMVSVTDFFDRELFVYEQLSKEYRRLQEDAKVPEEEMYYFLKTFDSNNEAIIMENLAEKGFKTYHRKTVVPVKFAELSIKQLAKFHALSFVTKKKDPEYFNTKIRTLKTAYSLNSDWCSFVNNVCTTAASVLNGKAKSKIEKYGPRVIELFQKYIIDIDSSSPYICLCHGDFKFQNILVKEYNGEAKEVCPIDYQLILISSPVNDFLFFIFTGTDQEFRRKHLDDLNELYFQSFAEFLRYFDMEVESTYPREAFEKDYEERLELGLAFGLYVAVFTFAQFDKGFDVRKTTLSELPLIPDEMFEVRVRGIVEDYVKWGYL